MPLVVVDELSSIVPSSVGVGVARLVPLSVLRSQSDPSYPRVLLVAYRRRRIQHIGVKRRYEKGCLPGVIAEEHAAQADEAANEDCRRRRTGDIVGFSPAHGKRHGVGGRDVSPGPVLSRRQGRRRVVVGVVRGSGGGEGGSGGGDAREVDEVGEVVEGTDAKW